MTENTFYPLAVVCKNCHYEYEAKIPVGKKYEDVKCEHCKIGDLEEQRPKQFGISPEANV